MTKQFFSELNQQLASLKYYNNYMYHKCIISFSLLTLGL